MQNIWNTTTGCPIFGEWVVPLRQYGYSSQWKWENPVFYKFIFTEVQWLNRFNMTKNQIENLISMSHFCYRFSIFNKLPWANHREPITGSISCGQSVGVYQIYPKWKQKCDILYIVFDKYFAKICFEFLSVFYRIRKTLDF